MNSDETNSRGDRKNHPLLDPRLYSTMTRLLVGGIMLCLGLWLLGGIINLLRHLYITLTSEWGQGAEQMIIEVVLMLAILELVRTLQSYLELGRVKLTLILDAALVVLIGELISLWYQDYAPARVFFSMSVITLLTLLRIVTVKFSPESGGPGLAGDERQTETKVSSS